MTGDSSIDNQDESAAAPRILTNTAFWQSETWRRRVDSIHPGHGRTLAEEPPWWRQAWSLFRASGAYDLVITLGVRESMAYGLLCLLAGRDPKQIMTEVFIDEPRNTPAWLVKTWLYRRLARRSLGILTNSTGEIATMSERYRLPKERFRFVPLNSTLADAGRSDADDGYLLSAGRTLRDYPTLVRAAATLDTPVRIVCGHDDVFPEPLPPHVLVERELAFADYVRRIARCTLLVVPLHPTGRATGQVVMLDAMAMGKPVIATRTPGTVDYIRHGENGWLVEPGDADGLARAIATLLADPALRRRLGDQALADVHASYTFDTHAALKLNAVMDLYEKEGGTR